MQAHEKGSGSSRRINDCSKILQLREMMRTHSEYFFSASSSLFTVILAARAGMILKDEEKFKTAFRMLPKGPHTYRFSTKKRHFDVLGG